MGLKIRKKVNPSLGRGLRRTAKIHLRIGKELPAGTKAWTADRAGGFQLGTPNGGREDVRVLPSLNMGDIPGNMRGKN